MLMKINKFSLKLLAVVMMIIVLIGSGGCRKKKINYNDMGDDINISKVSAAPQANNTEKPLTPPKILTVTVELTGFEKIIQKYISDAGFEVELEVFKVNSPKSAKEYYDKIVKAVASGDIDAFCINTNVKRSISLLDINNYTMNIEGLLFMYAPNYYGKLIKNDVDVKIVENNEYIPVNIAPIDLESNRLAVVVKTKLAEKYEGEINNLDDYLLFMKFAKDNGYQCPSYMLSEDTLLTMVIQDIGCYIIDEAFNDSIKTYAIAKFEETDFDNIEYAINNDKIISNLDKIHTAVLERMINTSNSPGSMASILLQKKDVTTYQAFIAMFGELIIYPLYTNYPVIAPLVNDSDKLYISANSNNPQGVFEFVEFINLNQENYDLYRYGEQNTDYALIGNQYQVVRQDSLTWSYLSHLMNTSLINAQYERSSVGIPLDYEDYFKTIVPDFNTALSENSSTENIFIMEKRKAAFTTSMILNAQNINGIHKSLVDKVLDHGDFISSVETIKSGINTKQWDELLELYKDLLG